MVDRSRNHPRITEEDDRFPPTSRNLLFFSGSHCRGCSACLLILLIASNISGAFSQPLTPQTFYPFLWPPPPPTLPPPPRGLSEAAAVGTSIGVTFAATLILFGLAFFLLLRFWKRHGGRKVGGQVLPLNSGFVRVSGNLKGVIVDELGMDVLYWKSIENGGNTRPSFKEMAENRPNREEERTTASMREKRKSPPIQEVPLLRGRSSTSESPIWANKDQMTPSPPPNPVVAVAAAGKNVAPPQQSKREKIESFKFEGDIMEAMFGYMAKNRKEQKQAVPSSQIFILDSTKSESTASLLKSLGVTRNQITEALIEGETQKLTRDAMEKLARIAPSKEEISQILAFNGDPTRLAEAELFFYHLLTALPSAFARLNAALFQKTFDSEVSQVRECLQSLESACAELRPRGLFLKLLEGILKAGSKLGNAQGLNITALTKLSDLRSSDGKTTLLHFVVQEVIRAEGKRFLQSRNSGSDSGSDSDPERDYIALGLPVVAGLSAEFLNVKRIAALEHDAVFNSIANMAAQLTEAQKTAGQCDPDVRFARRMKGFLETAESEMKAVKEQETRAMALVKATVDSYGAGLSNGANLFVIVRDFLAMVDRVCAEIGRNLEIRKASTDSSSPGSPRVFRFPKLSANFIADNSKSDTENDSQAR